MNHPILIFDNTLSGHHLEYAHHLYEMAVADADSDYVFVLPPDFEKEKDKFDWPNRDNIEIDLLSDDEVAYMGHHSLLITGYYNSKILRRYTKKHHATHVFLITLMQFVPFVLFLLPRSVKVSGIIYRIGLYHWKQMSTLRKTAEYLTCKLLARRKNMAVPFILNDPSAVCAYNKVYKTEKFKLLPDPFCIPDYAPKDIRQSLGARETDKVFFHFGALTGRKGTIKILEAIKHIPLEERKDYVFVFAGKVSPDIKDAFYRMTEELKASVRFVIHDTFVPFELIADLCHSSDCLLIPYNNNIQSSGVIGYASKYNIPVIGPNEALLGKLIRRYRLGVTGDVSDAKCLADMMRALPKGKDVPPTYSDENTKDAFIKAIHGAIAL